MTVPRSAATNIARNVTGIPLADARALLQGVPFDIDAVKQRLEASGGGYEIVHASPGLEVGVYVLWAPEPDHQQPHADDEVYVVLDGWGTLDVEGTRYPLEPGRAVFVPAGAQHQFVGYEQLSVLVIFARRWRIDAGAATSNIPA
jgi:mannose-6-phosphate isomerase-like protein (cupin superfamily)